MQPWVAPTDAILQELFTSIVVFGLQALSLPVIQEGNQILGLATEINVTQACVGSSVLAHTVALVSFITVLFIHTAHQFKTAIQMTGVILLLNVFRIGLITYLGDSFFALHFDTIHFYIGILTAFLSYLFVAIWTFKATRSCSTLD